MPESKPIPKKPKSVGGRIRLIRGGRTQERFAAELNAITFPQADRVPCSRIAQAMISRYEGGSEVPNPYALLRLARAGNTSIEWILTGREV